MVNKMHLMAAGDILLLYTDGLSELENKNKQLYYTPKTGGKLQTVIEKNYYLTAKELFDKIKEDIFRFAKPQDDLSYIIIKKT